MNASSRMLGRVAAIGLLCAMTLRPCQALPASDVSRSAGDFAAYVWNGREVMEQSRQGDELWNSLKRMSITRLMLALDGAQLQQAQAQPDELKGFLGRAKEKGIAVELLLGEPSWIEREHRGKLIKIIEAMRGFAFAGLHLDIEPDQIYKQPLSRAQFDSWVATLSAAARVSPWPTGVSVHPRYFRDEPYAGWNLGQRLKDAGVSEVALMIFSSNPQKVAEIARPIIEKTPELRFRVAQSVERGLSRPESYAWRSTADFRAAMGQLRNLLAAESNAGGVAVQAWADLMSMKDESEIR